jgi:hypothetical protein
MQITINVPTPLVRTYATARFAAIAPLFIAHNLKENREYNKRVKKATKAAAEYDAYIAEAQAKIGPYVPVSYTQVWA